MVELSVLTPVDLRIMAGERFFTTEPADVAIIIGSVIKGARMLNRIPPHDACFRTMIGFVE